MVENVLFMQILVVVMLWAASCGPFVEENMPAVIVCGNFLIFIVSYLIYAQDGGEFYSVCAGSLPPADPVSCTASVSGDAQVSGIWQPVCREPGDVLSVDYAVSQKMTLM